MFWIVVGTVIGIIIYILLISLHPEDYIMSRKAVKRFPKRESGEPEVEAVVEEDRLRPRFCPVCGSRLGPKDVIYAEIIKSKPHDKVVIKGCKYCYVPSLEELKKMRKYKGE